MESDDDRDKEDITVSNWRCSTRPALTLLTLIVAAQLTIPIGLAVADHQPRFAWQMFSGSPKTPEFRVETTLGSKPIRPEDYLLRARSELDLETLLPPYLCSANPEAVRVTWDGGEWEC